MLKRRWAGALGLISIGLLAGCLSAQSPASLAVTFQDMDPHIGQRLEARLIEAGSGLEIARRTILSISSGMFVLEFAGVQTSATYHLDVYADLNGNGHYDAPPADHAWRIEIETTDGSTEIVFVHHTDFADIAWPAPSGLSLIDGRVDPGEYPHSFLEPATGMEVFWRNDSTDLTFAMVSPGTGWVSIGLDPESAMEGANFILAAVRSGELIIEDHFGTGRFSHTKDLHQDILEAAGIEDAGRTTVEFRIPLDSGDVSDKRLRPGETYTLLLAYHTSSDNLTTRHTHRAVASFTLD